MERLTKTNPNDAGWQFNLAGSYYWLAMVYRQSNDRDNALAALQQSKAIMERVVKLSPDKAEWKDVVTDLDNEIAALTK